jgi:hypothetical protein
LAGRSQKPDTGGIRALSPMTASNSEYCPPATETSKGNPEISQDGGAAHGQGVQSPRPHSTSTRVAVDPVSLAQPIPPKEQLLRRRREVGVVNEVHRQCDTALSALQGGWRWEV